MGLVRNTPSYGEDARRLYAGYTQARQYNLFGCDPLFSEMIDNLYFLHMVEETMHIHMLYTIHANSTTNNICALQYIHITHTHISQVN